MKIAAPFGIRSQGLRRGRPLGSGTHKKFAHRIAHTAHTAQTCTCPIPPLRHHGESQHVRT
eukprot:547226-Prymnesium_polylepis.1